jgi:hypothetical protein
MEKEFVPYNLSLRMKQLGFDEPCLAWYQDDTLRVDVNANQSIKFHEYLGRFKGCFLAPLYQQAINFLYICSNKQIDIELKGSDTHEERIRKIEQGCKDLWNLQNNKSK